MNERELSLERMTLARAAQRLRPANGTLELTPLCTMNCRMCYVRLSRAEMEAQGRLRTAEEWIALGRQMERAGVLFLLLTGGEPLLHPEFREIYTALRRMGMILTVNTNGTLIDEEWAAFFGRQKPRRINVTLYGASRATYDALCGWADGYEKTVRALRLLKAAGVDVKINGSVTPLNVQDMDSIYALGRELDMPVHMDTYMVPCTRERSRAFDAQARLHPEEAAQARVKALRAEMPEEQFRLFAAQVLERIRHPAFPYGREMSCMAGKCSFAVNWQGEMRPCVTLNAPSVPVFERGFEAAWQEITSAVQPMRIHEKCAVCALRPLCDTCAASAYWETGDCGGVPEYLCRYAQETARLLEK